MSLAVVGFGYLLVFAGILQERCRNCARHFTYVRMYVRKKVSGAGFVPLCRLCGGFSFIRVTGSSAGNRNLSTIHVRSISI